MHQDTIPDDFPVPVLGVAAQSGTGKTTLLEKLIPELVSRGVRLATIKRSHHDFAIDTPGKDSYRHREAGACQVVLASPYRSVYIAEGDGKTEPTLVEQLAMLNIENLDLTLVEGYRNAAIPKIEIHRAELERPLLSDTDKHIIAIVSNTAFTEMTPLPVLPLDDISAITDFVQQFSQQHR